jgi:uncharacterized membrane protein
MRYWLITIVLIVLALVGIGGLLQGPVSDCSQLYGQNSLFSLVALALFAALIWMLPIDRAAHAKGLAALLALLVALVIIYRPSMMDQYRIDVIGCVGKAGAPPRM